MKDKIDLLINTLLDYSAREDERDDAAMDLGEFDDDRALNALSQVASNPNEKDLVLNSCGESIAEILVKKGQYNQGILNKIAPTAQFAA